MRLGRALVVAVWLVALPMSGVLSPASALTEAERAKIVEAVKKRPPMEFFVVKGAPDACGRGCDSWIAAEGGIDADAAGHLRQLLQKLGKLKLPIYFWSPGGDLTQGREIGRMLHARGMTAGVGRTLAAKCLPAKSVDECASLIRANRESEAVLRTDYASCVSACAIAVFGATTREIAPNALLGVHSGISYLTHVRPGISKTEREVLTERAEERLEKATSSYLAEMKLDKGLAKIIHDTKYEDMHYLTRAELFDLGIDRREPVENGWHFGYQPIPLVGSAAFVNLRDAGGVGANQKRMLIVSCGSSTTFTLTSLQQLPNASARPKADIRISAGGFRTTLTPANGFLTTYKNETFEVRQLRIPRARFDALVQAPIIGIVEERQPSVTGNDEAGLAPMQRFPIPGSGGIDVFETLTAHCTPTQIVSASSTSPAASQAASSTSSAASAAALAAAVAKLASPANPPSAGAEPCCWRYEFLPVAAIGSAAYMRSPWTAHPTLIAISCAGGRDTFMISTVQRLPDPSATLKIDIAIGDPPLGIALPGSAATLKLWKGDPYDLRQAKFSSSVIEKLLTATSVAVKETPSAAAADSDDGSARKPSRAQYWMSTTGGKRAFEALSDQCAILN